MKNQINSTIQLSKTTSSHQGGHAYGANQNYHKNYISSNI